MYWVETDISAQNAQPAQGMYCPNCGRMIQPNTSFCTHCRAAILRRYCPGCNRLVPDATKVCPYCTTPATAKPRLRRFSFSPTSVGTGVAIVVSLFLVIQGMRNTNVVQTKPVSSPAPLQAESVVTKISSITAPAVKPAAAVEDPTLLNRKGHELIQQKKYAEAVDVLQRAVNGFEHNTNAPSYPYALFNLGQALRLSGHPKAAIPLMNGCMNSIADPEMAKRELALDYQAVDSPQ